MTDIKIVSCPICRFAGLKAISDCPTPSIAHERIRALEAELAECKAVLEASMNTILNGKAYVTGEGGFDEPQTDWQARAEKAEMQVRIVKRSMDRWRKDCENAWDELAKLREAKK